MTTPTDAPSDPADPDHDDAAPAHADPAATEGATAEGAAPDDTPTGGETTDGAVTDNDAWGEPGSFTVPEGEVEDVALGRAGSGPSRAWYLAAVGLLVLGVGAGVGSLLVAVRAHGHPAGVLGGLVGALACPLCAFGVAAVVCLLVALRRSAARRAQRDRAAAGETGEFPGAAEAAGDGLAADGPTDDGDGLPDGVPSGDLPDGVAGDAGDGLRDDRG